MRLWGCGKCEAGNPVESVRDVGMLCGENGSALVCESRDALYSMRR